ncbi:hypothetical protein GPECTOR_34g776 [Gonium pectorale]|uniref:non-specific serine/threonine protein kinase n=1 Tax=Gonium pectorale TaxID=33097 RepID=A0A150GCP9_GONPE|nr:hypothetical protein GPECTOR_34g776 [Gonium pectorale]|eukprot:KXZ47617.1 hypothetical protein GPECTOR_34g776 [Gonium pectorale]
MLCFMSKVIERRRSRPQDDHAGALREAQLLDSLDHPNIIRYRESFVDKDGSLCIVTSFCEEGDLFTRIRKKASQKEYFTEQEVMNMFVQIASAISYIHSKRVLHRDLKTQNIFIARGGIIKLGDFGISKVLERTDAFATTVTGTPYYMAPEICTNQPYTYKSDIWSLGCVLYELCTLKHAFAADSLLSLVYQIVRGNFPPIPTDQFSSGLSDLVNRLLARDAGARPSLGEVFKLSYVQQHLERFKAEEHRRSLKPSTSLARRKQLLDAAPGGGENDAHLTPRQKVERKKAIDRERRELEMRLAAMSANKNREQAAARKKEMLYGSNVGLPSAQPQQQQQQGFGFEDDELPNMGTVRVEETSRGAPTRGGSRGIWDVDAPGPAPAGAVNPYGATLPSQARIQQQQQQQQQATASALDHGSPGGAGQWTWDRNGMAGLADDMPNMGTVQMTHGPGQLPSHGSPARPLEYTAGNRTNASDSPLMGSVNLGNSRTLRTAANATAGGALGVSAGRPQSGGGGALASDRPASSYSAARSYGGASVSYNGGGASPSPAVRQAAGSVHASAAAGRHGAASAPHASAGHHAAHHRDDDDDDGAYSDDFEEDDDEDQVVQHQRSLIIQKMEAASRMDDGRESIAAVKERVLQIGAKSDKVRTLHQKGLTELGTKFDAVYDYLSRVRRQEPPPEEREVQRRLLEIVGDKTRMPGCFTVDQLVFTEQMYS